MKDITVVQVLTKLNNYFFDADDISISDFLWFYGSISAMVFLAFIFIIAC